MIASASGWVSDIKSLPYLPDGNTLNWIVKPFVLSQSFKKVCRHFRVHKLNQQIALPAREEVIAFSDILAPNEKAFIREVLLCDNSKPLSYGRILAPQATYQAFAQAIDQLGSEPFGEKLLYSHPSYVRSHFEYQHLSGFDVYPNLINYLGEAYRYHEAWGRCSTFHLGNHPLVVVEVFMPDLPDFPQFA